MASQAQRPVPDLELRASDADREHAIELLRRHCAAGRISLDELSERIDAVYAASTLAHVRRPLADLPAEPDGARLEGDRPRGSGRAYAPELQHLPVLVVAAVLIAATAATGAWWLLWLLFPLLSPGMGRCRRGGQASKTISAQR